MGGLQRCTPPFFFIVYILLIVSKISIRYLSNLLLSYKFCNDINVYSCHIRDLLNRKTIYK